MKKLLNTLFVTSEDAFLSLDGETVCVKIDQKKVGQFPLHTLENIICFSYKGATPALMGECAQRGINFSFFTPNGKFLCRIAGEAKGNVLLRKQQYRISDQKSDSCEVARNFILGKVFNCRWCMDRTLRDHKMRVDAKKLQDAISFLTQRMGQIKKESDLDSLRGVEGECATIYFSVFDELILNQKTNY